MVYMPWPHKRDIARACCPGAKDRSRPQKEAIRALQIVRIINKLGELTFFSRTGTREAGASRQLARTIWSDPERLDSSSGRAFRKAARLVVWGIVRFFGGTRKVNKKKIAYPYIVCFFCVAIRENLATLPRPQNRYPFRRGYAKTFLRVPVRLFKNFSYRYADPTGTYVPVPRVRCLPADRSMGARA